jgi:5-methylcytosine-specific restriction protein A
MAGRSVSEWTGSSPDAAIPMRVKLRIWERERGRCHITGKPIRPGDSFEYEHIKPLCLGGEHREMNIALALTEPHREKSAAEVSAKAKADRVRAKHIGAWPKSRTPLRSRGFPKRKQSISIEASE